MSDARTLDVEVRDDRHSESMMINMGPQHPSTHGVLRLVLELDGEVVVKADPVIGYLHRAKEKIGENLSWHQFIPYTDRLDYLAPLANNVAYAVACEKLMGIPAPPRAEAIRVICCELARISAHLLGLVEETLERHLALREHTALARAALEALRADQARLFELIGFAFGREGSTTLH